MRWQRIRNLASVACQRYPLVRDVTMFGSLFVGAELSQQTLLKKVWKMDANPDYDIAALGRFAVFGVTFYPLIYNRWYKFLDIRFPGTSNPMIIKKVLCDQFILEPPLIVAFYGGMSVMEGKEDLLKETKLKFLPTLMAGCLFWMPAMAANFKFLPPSMRVTFVGVCTFTWCNFLCWLKRKEMMGPEPMTPSLLAEL